MYDMFAYNAFRYFRLVRAVCVVGFFLYFSMVHENQSYLFLDSTLMVRVIDAYCKTVERAKESELEICYSLISHKLDILELTRL